MRALAATRVASSRRAVPDMRYRGYHSGYEKPSDGHFFTPSDRIGRNYTPTARGLTVRELCGGGYLGPVDGGPGSKYPPPMAPMRKAEQAEHQLKAAAAAQAARSPLARGRSRTGGGGGATGFPFSAPRLRSPQARRCSRSSTANMM